MGKQLASGARAPIGAPHDRRAIAHVASLLQFGTVCKLINRKSQPAPPAGRCRRSFQLRRWTSVVEQSIAKVNPSLFLCLANKNKTNVQNDRLTGDLERDRHFPPRPPTVTCGKQLQFNYIEITEAPAKVRTRNRTIECALSRITECPRCSRKAADTITNVCCIIAARRR